MTSLVREQRDDYLSEKRDSSCKPLDGFNNSYDNDTRMNIKEKRTALSYVTHEIHA